MTDITKHAEFEDTYDNPDHPIPSLTNIEVLAGLKSGGAELQIIIAEPLQSDDYSLNRLLDKIEGYLNYVKTPEFDDEFGPLTAANTIIVVNIHPDSCAEAFALLKKSKAWVAENQASLKVKRLELG